MKTIFSVIAFILAANLFATCERAELLKNTPSCIKNKIDELKKSSVRNPPASVWQYEYNGQTVYFIPQYCCDVYSELYDSNCNLLCSPDGGITGAGDGKCKDFFTKRTNGVLIWQDERK